MKYIFMIMALVIATTLHAGDKDDSVYEISVEVNAPVEKSIQVIRNFKDYPEWNSVLRMEENDNLVVGEKFQVTILKDQKKKERFKAKVLQVDENTFSARQVVCCGWFFTAVHHFILEKTGENTSRLTQRWELHGMIYGMFKSDILETLASFKTMNAEFKQRVENL